MKESIDLNLLYFGTFGMLTLSLAVIILVIWATRSIKNFKDFAQKRDEHYMSRLDGIEGVLRTEFKAMLDVLKK